MRNKQGGAADRHSHEVRVKSEDVIITIDYRAKTIWEEMTRQIIQVQ